MIISAHRRTLIAWTALLATLAAPSPSGGQAPEGTDRSAVVFHSRDLVLFGAATAGSFALTRIDVRMARAFADSSFHARHPGLHLAARVASHATETVWMISGATGWAVGRLSHDPGLAAVSLHTAESVASAAAFIQIIRGTLGRARPYVVDDDGDTRNTDQYEFQALHGFTSYNYRSYPSMHAMASMAGVTALVQEMRFRGTPNRELIGPVLYAAAVVPSLARMYLDEHWTSDIGMGMFLGVFAGQRVVQYTHAHPDNRVDRKLLAPSVRASLTFGGGPPRLTVLPF